MKSFKIYKESVDVEKKHLLDLKNFIQTMEIEVEEEFQKQIQSPCFKIDRDILYSKSGEFETMNDTIDSSYRVAKILNFLHFIKEV